MGEKIDIKKKIVIIGGFGWMDIGDEAMPQSVIYNLRKILPDVDIVMLSPNPSYTNQYHKERSIYDINSYLNKKVRIISLLNENKKYIYRIIGKIFNRLYPKKLFFFIRFVWFLIVVKLYSLKIRFPINNKAENVIKELAEADLLFNNGGGNINTLLSGELYKQTITIFAASILKVPVILSGQTIGPITNRLHAFLVKKALDKAELITFRDRGISMGRTKKIGVCRAVMKDTADDAVSLPFLTKNKVEKLIIENNGSRWLELAADLIAIINMNGYLLAMGKTDVNDFGMETQLLSTIADQLVKQYNAKILLVPTDYHSTADDRPLLNNVKNNMKSKERALVIEKEYDAVQYKSLIGLGDIAIGARYHFNVFATSMGVPCIGIANGIYQKTKLKGIMELYNLSYCFIKEDMDKVEFAFVWNIVENVLKNRDQISSQLKETTIKIQERSLMTIQRAVEILSS